MIKAILFLYFSGIFYTFCTFSQIQFVSFVKVDEFLFMKRFV